VPTRPLRLRSLIGRHRILAVLLVLGAALRVWATLAYRPAVLGYADGTEYLVNGVSDLWRNIGRPIGYPILIRGVTEAGGGLVALVTVQHLIGLATAVLLYAMVRSLGGPAWAAAIPAAAVLLSGDQVYTEHSPLSETLFALTLALAIACCLRTSTAVAPRTVLAWATAAGALAGVSATVRYVGEALVPILALWTLTLGVRGGIRPRLLAAAVLCAASAVVIAGYVGVRALGLQSEGGTQGQTGLAVPGSAMYGRVAPFADCKRFTPPAGTEPLCDPTPASQRQGPGWHVFYGSSPLRRAPIEAQRRVNDFALAALRHQPDDYAIAVLKDVGRYVAPSALKGPGIGWGDEASGYRFGRPRLEEGRAVEVATSLFGPTRIERGSSVSALDRYQAIVRLHGGLLGLLVLLGVAGAFVADRRVRAAIVLLLAVTLTALVVPVAVATYDARYAVPVEGLVAAAGALGAWALAARLTRVRR
jgi:hypothetical protein